MTQRTVIIMDSAYYIVTAHAMTDNTVCIRGDRGVAKTVICVMRLVTVYCSCQLVIVTVNTLDRCSGCDYAGNCGLACSRINGPIITTR